MTSLMVHWMNRGLWSLKDKPELAVFEQLHNVFSLHWFCWLFGQDSFVRFYGERTKNEVFIRSEHSTQWLRNWYFFKLIKSIFLFIRTLIIWRHLKVKTKTICRWNKTPSLTPLTSILGKVNFDDNNNSNNHGRDESWTTTLLLP